MSDIEISIDSGTSKRLLTAGKYCDKNILVTALSEEIFPYPAEEKDVNFYDYDGTLLYAYSISEAQALENFPEPPKHDGLIFQEWNYSFENVKSTTKPIDVGATYITDDGKTRFYLSFTKNAMENKPPIGTDVILQFEQSISNGVIINWGDGNQTETITGTGFVTLEHKYIESGCYLLTLEPLKDCTIYLGKRYFNERVLKTISDTSLKKIELGKNISYIGSGAFVDFVSLSKITVPKDTGFSFDICIENTRLETLVFSRKQTGVYKSFFRKVFTLKKAIFSDTITKIGNDVFYNCMNLKSVVIPDSVVSLENNFSFSDYRPSINKIILSSNITSLDGFKRCENLLSLVVPEKVEKIGTSTGMFGNCRLKELYFLSIEPPVMQYSIISSGIENIYVPKGSGEAYKTATNWVQLADKIKEME